MNKLKILFCMVFIEYGLFIYAGVGFSFLQGDTYFNITADPIVWIFYLLKAPQFITTYQWSGILLDISVMASLLLMIRNPRNYSLSKFLFILLLLFYVTLTGYLAHRNYQVGFFMVFIPFLFKSDVNKWYAFEATRYYLLFFYVSAAYLKITSPSFLNQDHFSHLLSGQFTPYYLEGNTGLRLDVNLYLMSHPAVSYILYLLSFIVELSTLIGFFTKRFDKWLAWMLFAFHCSNWFIMDIAPLGQIAFISLLFLSKDMKLKQPQSISSFLK